MCEPQNYVMIKTEISDFYKKRSKFVHGKEVVITIEDE